MQRVSQLELGLLVVLFHFSTGTGFMMSPLFSSSGYQGWLTLIIAAGGGLLITYIAIVFAKQRSSEFIVHYGRELVGRWVHTILMVGCCFFIIHIAGMVLRQVTDFLIQVYLPTTPSWAVASLFGLVVTIAVRTGIEAIFRCAAGFFFVIFGGALLVPPMVASELTYDRAVAFWTHLDGASLFQTAIPFIPWFGEMMVVIFIFPYLANTHKTFRTLWIATLASLVTIEISFVLCALLFGAPLSGQMVYPVLEMIRFIRLGDFLENLDPVVIAIWLASLFIKISFLLYVPVLIATQLMGLKDTKPFSFSFGSIMLGISISIAPNTIELNQFIAQLWPAFAFVVECLPIIYGIMYLIKKHRVKAPG